jgi:hypothetical protein
MTVAEAKRAIELAGPRLREVNAGGKRYWRGTSSPAGARGPTVHLLPSYDELVVAYGDRSASIDEARLKKIGSWAMVIANNLVAVNGQAVGGWRRVIEKKAVIVETVLRRPLDGVERAGLRAAAERLQAFLGVPVKLRSSGRDRGRRRG